MTHRARQLGEPTDSICPPPDVMQTARPWFHAREICNEHHDGELIRCALSIASGYEAHSPWLISIDDSS